ncbi:MAG: HAMP domain-containing histidine kinase [Saprospiraceae bacterium]|nr:HAMP domain-containing histidine kinase [Saprospiraceae bacterium]
MDSGRFDDARRVYNDVESYFISVGDDVGLARNNADLGFLEIELKNYKKAIAYCKSGVDVLVERGDVNGARDAFECLYYAATEMGDYKSALKYFEQNIAYRDSLNKQEDIEKVTELRKDFEFEREREKTESANILNIEKEKTFQNYLALGILLLSGLLFFAFRAYRIKKKAAETISNQKDEIEKYSQINENLIFSLSHDIKEPMLGVQILLNKIKSEDAYLQTAAISIGEQVGSINSIVNNLLQLKKASSSNEIETSTPIEIIETVAKVTQALSYRISERNIQIINQLSDSDTLNLPISSKKLYMVTLNLLSNAIKHSPEGAKIEIYSTKDGLFIRDYGEGIDPTILDKIGKEHIYKTDQRSGSGMGLMLVNNVLLGSGLKLHFENVLGGGTLAGLKMDAE